MFFQSSVRLLVYFRVLFLVRQCAASSSPARVSRAAPTYEPRCRQQNMALDQVHKYEYLNTTQIPRRKRFVLFPEFELFLDDQRYVNRTHDMSYWISNFYPKRISTDYIHRCIEDIIRQISEVIDKPITPQRAVDPGAANFHYVFFDYTVCPTDDVPRATVDGVKLRDELYIYPAELTRKSRYRAHGGIHFDTDESLISQIKFNMQQTFVESDDWVYDPVVYTCNDTANVCELDTHYVLFHETLHGYAIEHTTNARNPIPPNPHVQSLMHFSYLRFLCHDDIRAIRMIFKLPVIREHVEYDDTCRRDFPMNWLQRLMFRMHRATVALLLYAAISSAVAFVGTIIYLLVRLWQRLRSGRGSGRSATVATNPWPTKDKIPIKRHGYLWHDEML